MRRFLWTLLSISLPFMLNAQEEHLTFKRIPIDGSMKQFVSRLELNGFTRNEEKDNFLFGDFAGYTNCVVVIPRSNYTDIVFNVTVFFPPIQNDWKMLEENYFDLKARLTGKYGKPSEAKEEFVNGTPIYDFLRFYELENGNCVYRTIYDVEKGTIVLEMKAYGPNMNLHSITLSYIDSINGKLVLNSSTDDL